MSFIFEFLIFYSYFSVFDLRHALFYIFFRIFLMPRPKIPNLSIY